MKLWPFFRSVEKPPAVPDPEAVLRFATMSEASLSPLPSTEGLSPIPAVFCAVHILADALASLPLSIVTSSGADVPQHPALTLMEQDSPVWPAWARKEHLFREMLVWGAGYLYLLNPVTGLPVSSAYSTVRTEEVGQDNRVRAVYDLVLAGSERRLSGVPRSSVVGIYAEGYNGVTAPSPVQRYAGGTLAVAQLAAQHLQGTLRSGMHVSGTIESPAEVGDGLGWSFERIQALRKRIEEQFAGIRNTGKTPVFPPGWSFKPGGWNAVDLALVDLLKFSVEDVCRIYRVPPVRLYHYLSGRFAEENEKQNGAFASWSLAPRCRMIEAHLTAQLLRDEPQLRFVMDERAVGSGTLAERVAAVDQAVARAGVMTINEARQYLSTGLIPPMGPIEGGDRVIDPKGAPTQQPQRSGAGGPEPETE